MSEAGTIPTAWRVTAVTCTAAAFAWFAWVAAAWLWRAMNPPPPPIVTAGPADPAAAIVASGLWAAGATDAPAPVALAAGGVRLLGVLAERDGGGMAVFRTAAGVRVVTTGGEVVPGTTLAHIDAARVRLRDATGEREVELQRDDPARAGSPTRVVSAPKAAPTRPEARPACAVPAGFSGPMLKLHGELLDGLIAQPDSWRGMLAAEGASLVVREDGGFVTMLGLAKGDRLLQANGIPLREPDDVIGAVLRPLVASQSVRLAGSRSGQPREIYIVNAGTCP